jgi:AAA domain
MDETSSHHDEFVNPKHWRRLTSRQRTTLIDQISVTYSRLDELSCAFTALDAAACSREGAVQSLGIVGPPKTGKTLLARRWVAHATARRAVMPAGEDAPYLFVELSWLTTPRDIAARCLAALGDPSAARGTLLSMEHRLQVLLRTRAIRLLLVDQLERLLRDERRRLLDDCVDLLRHMILNAGVSTVLLGEQQATAAMLSVCPRLERLVGTLHVLAPFAWDEQQPRTVEEFRALMRSIDEQLPLDDSGLEEQDMAYCTWYATNGTLGWIMALIRQAAKYAVASQSAALDRRLLAQAYEACIAATPLGQGKVNPFSG